MPLPFFRMKSNPSILIAFTVLLMSVVAGGCKKQEIVDVPDNLSPYYDEIPTIIVNNYVNKVFIDLLGREPTDQELTTETDLLQATKLSFASREALIDKLQTSTVYVPVDSSYSRAYHRWFYEQCKSRFIEGASVDAINEELGQLSFALTLAAASGDTTSQEYLNALEGVQDIYNLLAADTLYEQGIIDVIEVSRRMIDNAVYDKINMNSFNLVNAAFDDLYFRFPTISEFDAAFTMVESGEPALLFGQTGANKNNFIYLMTHSSEMYEGMIIWAFQTLLARRPSTVEVYALLPQFAASKNFKAVQKAIIRTDEYGHFD